MKLTNKQREELAKALEAAKQRAVSVGYQSVVSRQLVSTAKGGK